MVSGVSSGLALAKILTFVFLNAAIFDVNTPISAVMFCDCVLERDKQHNVLISRKPSQMSNCQHEDNSYPVCGNLVFSLARLATFLVRIINNSSNHLIEIIYLVNNILLK